LDAQAAKGVWRDKVSNERLQRTETKLIVDGLKQILLVMFATDLATLGELGIAPRKRSEPDPATLVARADKVRATREARHTMGPKKKLSIKGEVRKAPPATTATAPAPALTPSPVPPVSAGNGAAPKVSSNV
jgi:hypothetical protein